MADLLTQLQGFLSTEEGQAGLKQVAQMLGTTGNPTPTPAPTAPPTPTPAPAPTAPPAPAPAPVGESSAGGLGDLLSGLDLSALSQMFSQMQGTQSSPGGDAVANSHAVATADAPTSGGGFDLSGIDLGMIMKVQQMVQGMSHDDDNIRLLRSLKPHFSESRQKKVDQAIQLLRLYTLLPMIKETGLLGGLFGDAEQ